MRLSFVVTALGLFIGPAAYAQQDPAALEAAKAVVAKMQGNRTALFASMAEPMVGYVQQAGVPDREKADVVVREVVLPLMSDHYDELLTITAQSFAQALSAADLQAISAFYDTPAGQSLLKAQPQLAQAQLTGISQWMARLAPELQTKIVSAAKAHGWAPK